MTREEKRQQRSAQEKAAQSQPPPRVPGTSERPTRTASSPPDVARGDKTLKLPTKATDHWWQRKTPGALISTVAAVGGGLGKVVADIATDKVNVGTYFAFGVFLLGLVGGYAAWKKSRWEDQQRVERALAPEYVAMLVMMHGYMIAAHQRDRPDEKLHPEILRLTIHRVETDCMVQATGYVGCGGGDAGRKLPLKTGVVGKAVLQKKLIIARRMEQDHAAYRQQMVEEFNFTEQEVAGLRDDRHSWAAMPIFEGDRVVGALYLDSLDPHFFDEKESEIIVGCNAIVNQSKHQR